MIINILDSSIFNRISAGEVIENPSSVVKELIDNSIDAGASDITISILDGGIKSIEVVDNGCGIPNKELYKTILPHATSKLSNSDDLFSISTLGFRGEALASISSVSDVEIRTHYKGEEFGSILSLENNSLHISETAWTNGTSILIKNIFYNTPARYKFLNPKSTEENNIKKVVIQYILSNPDVSISYYSDYELIFKSNGLGLLDALQSVYGEKISNQLIKIEDISSPIKINGYISPPELYKNNRTFQTLVINGRVITDLSLTASIQNAYSNKLMKHCFPIFVLHVLIPFEEVDVNVHPTKREVRFSNPKKIYGKVYNIIKTSLDTYSQKKSESFLEFHGTENCSEVSFKNFNNTLIEPESEQNTSDLFYSTTINEDSNLENEKITTENTTSFIPTESTNIFIENRYNEFKFSIIGQIFNTYLIIEASDIMYLIDQHAFHERLLYDDYLLELNKKNLPIQQLFLPLFYDCSFEEHDILIENIESLNKLGFEIESFGNDSIRIIGIPAILSGNIDIKILFNLLVKDLLLNNSFSSVDSIIKNKVALMACKAAIKGNIKLSLEQIRYLIEYFYKSGIPLQCPHGRPTFITFSKNEFEKLFKRKL